MLIHLPIIILTSLHPTLIADAPAARGAIAQANGALISALQ